jgi:hypothetical protein
MIWRVVYSRECDEDIGIMPDPGDVCRAVQRFAADGSGDVEADPESSFIRIRAASGFAVASLDATTKTLYVKRLMADEPLARLAPLLDDPAPPDSE